ncbi:MAG: polysaccharide biosynthesis/export family protein [Cytophagales bacterium]
MLKSKNKDYPKTYLLSKQNPYKLKKGDKIVLFIESTVATTVDLIDQKFKNAANNSFILDTDGIIDLPLVGKVNALGLTVTELEETVEKRLKEYLEFITVRVVFTEFTLTFLGEFKSAGEKIIKDRVSINLLEALAISGGLSDYASPKKLKILRKNGDNIEVFVVDGSKENIIESQHFALHPNDLIYAEPLPGRNFRNSLQYITLLTSALTLSIFIITNTRFFR